MTSLKDTIIGPVTANGLKGSFFFSVCDGYFPEGTCGSEGGFMHSCLVSGDSSDQDDFGSELEYVRAEEGSSENDLSFILNFRDGNVCPDDNTQRLQSTVLFRCSPNAGIGYPQFLSYSSSTCTATFSWASQYACHSCLDSDYEEVVSACKNGRQTTELHKINSCNGVDRILVEESECTDIALPIGLVAGAVGLIIIMIIIVIFVIYRNRKITYKYTKLLQDQSAEMEAMADEIDERDGKSSMTKNLAPVSHDDEEDDQKEGKDDSEADELQDDEED